MERYSSSMGENVADDDEESPPLARKTTYPPDPMPITQYKSKLSLPGKFSTETSSQTYQSSYPPDKAAKYQIQSGASIESNDSGQGTYYSAGGGTVTELPAVSRTFNRSLSPASSQSASEAEKKTLAELEKEFTSLSLAIKAFQPNTATWLMIHGHLERAREEMDAVKQDIEMSPQATEADNLDVEGEKTSPPIPVPALNPVATKETNSVQSPRTRSPERSRSRSYSPGSRSQSPEPEVWIQVHEKDDNSLDNSMLTFDEWSYMERGNKPPDPEGITKYVQSAQLMAITENEEVDCPPENSNSKEEVLVIESGENAAHEGSAVVPDEEKMENVSNDNAGLVTTSNMNEGTKRKSKKLMKLFKS